MRILEPLLKVGDGDQLAGSADEQTDIDMGLAYNLAFTPVYVEFNNLSISLATPVDMVQCLTLNLNQGGLIFNDLFDDPLQFAVAMFASSLNTNGVAQGNLKQIYFKEGDYVVASNIRWARTNGTATPRSIGFLMMYKLVELTNAEVASVVARVRG